MDIFDKLGKKMIFLDSVEQNTMGEVFRRKKI